MPFNQIIGQNRVLENLRRMIASGSIPHALLFAGIAGVGKRTTAHAFAKALNCTQNNGNFCDACSSCRTTEDGNHPDCIEIKPEKNALKIDQVRDLQQNIMFAPVRGPWRIVIFVQAESMTPGAANCLLKTLEEPPEATILVLITNTVSRLLPTVTSRCQKIIFSPLTQADIMTVLQREGVDAELGSTVAAHAHGSLHRARLLLDASLIEDFTRLLTHMFEPCPVEQRLELARSLGSSAERSSAVLMLLLEWLRDLLLCRHGAAPQQLFNVDRFESLMQIAQQMQPHRLTMLTDRVMQLVRGRTQTINMQLALESLLLA
jgi:DNA polymerase III subunit delta'